MADQSNWERGVLEKVALAGLIEARRARRWGIFFKLTFLLFVIAVIVMIAAPDPQRKLSGYARPHTAVVDLEGPIASDSRASAELINAELEDAFKDVHTQGVILRLDSPGGSPVQSDEIYQQIKRLRELHPKIKLYAVCEDVCASGAYYVAAAADAIYANRASVVGSIGVIMSGFGFVDAIQKIGVTRRVLTAGTNKAQLDPFSPLTDTAKQQTQMMLDDVHALFIERVKAGRGQRLKINDETFSGRIWDGNEALQQGLIDGFGSVDVVARDIIKQKRLANYTRRPNPWDRIAKELGVDVGESLLAGALHVLNSNATFLNHE